MVMFLREKARAQTHSKMF